jgi:hypothetical protein
MILLQVVSCNGEKMAVIGEVSGSKSDEAATKEVIEAFYNEIKNFNWEEYKKEPGISYCSSEYQKELHEEYYSKLEESVIRQKITSNLQDIEFIDINIDNDKATVNLISYEECSSLVNEVLNGAFQGQDSVELIKENDIWRISNRSSQLLKVTNESDR